MSTPLLIPTRNRTQSLRGVLRYLRRFYPDTRVVIADGSSSNYQKANAELVKAFDDLAIDYCPYPEDLPFFARLCVALDDLDDDLVIMGSDDDFPILETLIEAEATLRRRPEFVSGMGATFHLTLASPTLLQVRFQPARPINGSTSLERARAVARWPFSTTYAVTRRELLLERYRRAQTESLISFFDLTVALHDAMSGRILALPSIGFFGTRNYSHSYWRPEAPLLFLRRADEVLAQVDRYKRDLMLFDELDEHEAQAEAYSFITQRIREHAGDVPHRRAGFADSPRFRHPVVQAQLGLFHDLFREGSEARARFIDRLRFISESMLSAAESDDNAGESKFYESIAATAVSTP